LILVNPYGSKSQLNGFFQRSENGFENCAALGVNTENLKNSAYFEIKAVVGFMKKIVILNLKNER